MKGDQIMLKHNVVKIIVLLPLIVLLFSCATMVKNDSYGSITKGMSTSDVDNKFGPPVQKHRAPEKVFGIEVINGTELWEYHEGANYIEAMWLVKFTNEKVIDLGRSQGAILSDIKFGYLDE
jgi:hypothetical protein